MAFLNLFIYLASFGLIWFGAGLIISAVDKYSKRVKLSPFAFSFLVLGLLTSIPEFSVGLGAVLEGKPDIFVGNLLGGVVVIFLLVIPLLAVLNNGIRLTHQFEGRNLVIALAVIAAPALFVSDARVSNLEGVILILLYLFLIILVERRKGVIENFEDMVDNLKPNTTLLTDIAKLIGGIVIVFFASNIILDKTLYFSNFFNISPFVISLIFLSIGTNLPELSLAVKGVILGKKDIVFGDYVGSAAANTLLFGVFTLLHNGEVLTKDGYLMTFLFIALGLVLFYLFSKSKQGITRAEGVVLILFYLSFVLFELLQ
ncbi:MAG: hypothetical protein Q8P13_00700 [bacterium]|nr:hypothetical protein [bacterium]